MKEAEYRLIEGVRSSTLATIASKTLAHAKYELENPREQTESMKLGSAFHDLILQGEEYFQKNWGVLPTGHDGRTKAGKELVEAFESAFEEKIIKQKDFELLKNWETSIKQNKLIKTILENISQSEVLVVWEENGIHCKARLDAIVKMGVKTFLIDLKTAVSASPTEFRNSCINYGYLIQSAHYLAGAKATGIIDSQNNNFYHIVVEKEALYLSAIYALDEAALDIGEQQRQVALKKYKEAKETGVWAGYSEKCETLALPHWYIQRQEFENDLI